MCKNQKPILTIHLEICITDILMKKIEGNFVIFTNLKNILMEIKGIEKKE